MLGQFTCGIHVCRVALWVHHEDTGRRVVGDDGQVILRGQELGMFLALQPPKVLVENDTS